MVVELSEIFIYCLSWRVWLRFFISEAVALWLLNKV